MLDTGFVEGTLRRQFQPLLDPWFDDILAAHYPKGVGIELNGRLIEKQRTQGRSARGPARYALNIQFEHRPDASDLARLVESTVLINDGHPAYRRAVASRSEGYHLALSVALALAPLAVETAREHRFGTAVLSRWGEALEPIHRRRR